MCAWSGGPQGGLVLGGAWSGGGGGGGVWSGGRLVSGLGGGVWSGGCLVWGSGGGVWSRGVSGGYIPACTEADPTPPVDTQTPVKILPWPNFVAAGNKTIFWKVLNTNKQ